MISKPRKIRVRIFVCTYPFCTVPRFRARNTTRGAVPSSPQVPSSQADTSARRARLVTERRLLRAPRTPRQQAPFAPPSARVSPLSVLQSSVVVPRSAHVRLASLMHDPPRASRSRSFLSIRSEGSLRLRVTLAISELSSSEHFTLQNGGDN